MTYIRSRTLYTLCLFLVLSMVCATAKAHFKLNLNVRIIHVEHVKDGLNAYTRLPMPYLVAHLLGEVDDTGLPLPAPYTRNRLEEGKLAHYVDVAQLSQSTYGLALLAAQGLDLSMDGAAVNANIDSIRIYKNGTQPNFATLEDARKSFEAVPVFDSFEKDVYVGDTTVDVFLRYASGGAVYDYALSSKLNPGLPDQGETANLVLDYSSGGVQVFRARGLLHDPIVVTRSVLDAVATFVKEGIKHILEGLDHVLFVICLVLGAMSLRPLLWRVTGFTIGHSVTLTIGFFGYVPSAAWFVPAVETGIALSIIYVALVAVLPDFKMAGPESTGQQNENSWPVVAVTGLIGLLHGLGFSFVLQNILQVTSPSIWQSLLAFNVGVEIGQIVIVLTTWLLLYIVGRLNRRAASLSRYLIAVGCVLMALYWVVERGSNIYYSGIAVISE